MKCRSCASNNTKLILNLGNHIPSNFYLNDIKDINKKKIPLKTYVCKDCWLVQIKDFIKGNKLFLKDYAYLSGVSSTWQKHCSDFTEYCIRNFKLKKNDKIIEIASNDGTLLNYFKKKNFDVLGIEPTSSTAKIAKKKGVKTNIQFFGYANSKILKQKYGSFKLIVANNVLAHVDNINDFVNGISNLASNETIISVEFQYLVNIIQKVQFDTIYHEHFSYYSLISFENLISKYNLKIFDVKKIKTHGGSLRVFLCKKNIKKKISSNTYTIKSKEKILGVNNFRFYDNFNKNVKNLKTSFQKFILNLKRNNKLIYAYGAAAKGNTFLNYMKINNKIVNFIIDKNKYKINKISPGGLIKIKSPHILNNDKPDYILILAWNIKHEIMNDLKKNFNFKKKFIISIPKLKILS